MSISRFMAGTVGAQLISLLALPFLLGLYGPVAFGAYALGLVVASVLGMTSTLQLDIVLYGESSDARAYVLRHCARLASTGIAALAMFVATGTLLFAATFSDPLRGTWLLVALLGCIQGALNAQLVTQIAWLSRRKHRAAAAAYPIRAFSTASIQIGLAFVAHTSGIALMIGGIAGTGLSLCALFAIRDGYTPTPAVRRLVTWHTPFWKLVPRILKRKRSYTVDGTLRALFAAASNNSSIALFGLLGFPAVAGLFAAAERIVRAPVLLLAGSMRQALFQEGAGGGNTFASSGRATAWTTALLAVLGVSGAVVSTLVPALINSLLAPEWAEAAPIIQLMIWWAVFNVSSVPSVSVLQINGRMRPLLVVDAAILLAKVISLPVLVSAGRMDLAIASAALLPALGSAAALCVGIRECTKYRRGESR